MVYELEQQQAIRSWTTRRDEKKRRLQLVSSWMSGPILPQKKLIQALELLIAPGDRIVLEGDNQKQADFHSRSLVQADPKKLHDLHLIISSVSRPEHVTLFELGIAKKRDFAFAGPQSLRVAQLLEDGVLEIGAIHTYVGLYSRLLVDLAPNAVLVCAEQADRINSIPFISIRCISLFTKRTVKRRKGQSGWTRERHAGRFCRSDKEFYRPDYQWVDCLSLPPAETRRQGHDDEESRSMIRFTYRLSDRFMEYGGCS